MAFIKKTKNNKDWWGCREKGKHVYCLWDYKLVYPLWKRAWRFLKKLKIELLNDPIIPLRVIYLKEQKTLIWKDFCTSMYTVTSFVTVKTWKQSKCPLMDEWIKNIIYICKLNRMLFRHTKRKSWHLQQHG